MDNKTITLLNRVNKEFYQTVYTDFDKSRGYFWKGWERLLKLLPKNRPLRVLDIGCGNGRFYEFLQSNGIEIDYLGIDNSAELLDIAIKKYSKAKFKKVDIIKESLDNYKDYDLIVSFGVFHHIPSLKLRKAFINTLSKSLNSTGILAISFWQFTKSKNLTKRVVDFENIGITLDKIEKGDYLLDWQRGSKALRYCHEVNENEMNFMIDDDENIVLLDTFNADGKTGELNLYMIVKKS